MVQLSFMVAPSFAKALGSAQAEAFFPFGSASLAIGFTVGVSSLVFFVRSGCVAGSVGMAGWFCLCLVDRQQ